MLKGKNSQYDPPYISRSSVEPGGQRDQEHGVVQQGYQQPKTSISGSSQVPKGLRMTPLAIQVDRWTVRSRTWGSSTCSGRRILIC